ncbi:MAG: protein phosphatase 2C domain-containing protein [Dehalococcoidia bacterium]
MTDRTPFVLTDRGLVRVSNQDAAYARLLEGGGVLLAVADGMGGPPAGDRASVLAIGSLEEAAFPGLDPARELTEAFETAHRAIVADAEAHAERSGMSTTLVAALVLGGTITVAHAGDSRAYRWHRGTLEALTTDHNRAAEAVRAGRLEADEARWSSDRHALTQALGGSRHEAEIGGPFPLVDGDVLLLVSDGVTGVLANADVEALVAEHRGAALPRALLEAVLSAGAPDNVAIALLDRRQGAPTDASR